MSLGNVFISGVYSPIKMKSGMKMDLWTLIIGKYFGQFRLFESHDEWQKFAFVSVFYTSD